MAEVDKSIPRSSCYASRRDICYFVHVDPFLKRQVVSGYPTVVLRN